MLIPLPTFRLEYQRQSRKELLKEQMIMQEKMELQATLNELAFQAERQDTQIRELTRVIADLGKFYIIFNYACYNLILLQIPDHGHPRS